MVRSACALPRMVFLQGLITGLPEAEVGAGSLELMIDGLRFRVLGFWVLGDRAHLPCPFYFGKGENPLDLLLTAKRVD